MGSLAGADGWSITNVAAFPISWRNYSARQPAFFLPDATPPMPLSPFAALIFNTTCE
jgi:hypothetical protein